MTWPTVDVVTTNTDSGTDSPATARADLLDLIQKFNQLRAHVSAFAATFLDDVDAAAVRITLGVPAGSGTSTGTNSGDQTNISGNSATANTAGNLTGTPAFFAPITNSLGANVALNNSSTYFDGPSVAQGTSGKWFASGTITVQDSTTSENYSIKLWDGTTLIASTLVQAPLGQVMSISLCGYISNPAGNIRISVKPSNINGFMKYNQSANSTDCTITAFRIG